MIREKCLVVYRNRPALVSGIEGGKLSIGISGGGTVKVREKDIEVIHPGPCSLEELEAPAPQGNAREAWELLAEDGASPGIPLQELTGLVYGAFTPRAAWAAWELLREGLYFTGDTGSVKARPRADVEKEEKKREEKGKENSGRAAFLEWLKGLPSGTGAVSFSRRENSGLPGDWQRHIQDVEALALGKTAKSRTMKELGRAETPEEAHRLLLASGFWTAWDNPHPSRSGLSRSPAAAALPPAAEEERLDLTGLPAYAIDNPWSGDPDDAVSLEGPDADGRYRLWIHVADPAASVFPGSPADREALGRGVTLYLPEGPVRMLSPGALPLFALGLGETSAALSIKITLNNDLSASETEISPSSVKVSRLTYGEADALIAEGEAGASGTGAVLAALAALAERNVERRLDTGAVMIEFPDVHIRVNTGSGPGENPVTVEPEAPYRSAGMVRECMILAGEGTARWALQRRLPFPFISQEAGELPAERLPGLAGAWQIRRCMRPRNLSVKPGVHWGLGLDQYTQVTSPLRRYTDLLCHQQIRAALGSGIYRGKEPCGEDDILYRISAAEAAASTAAKAERASKAHWMAVYLSDKTGTVFEAVVLDRKGSKGTVIIPALGLETKLGLRGNEAPNSTVNVSLLAVKIPLAAASFALV